MRERLVVVTVARGVNGPLLQLWQNGRPLAAAPLSVVAAITVAADLLKTISLESAAGLAETRERAPGNAADPAPIPSGVGSADADPFGDL